MVTIQQARQPKGTSTGGQFAASVNPESSIELPVELDTTRERSIAEIEAVIAMWEMRIEDLEEEYETVVETVVDTGSRREGDIDAAIDSARIEISGLRAELIEAMREDRRRNPSLKEIVLRRAIDQLSNREECSNCHEREYACTCETPTMVAVPFDESALSGELEQYELEHKRDWDAAFEGINYVVDSLLDWREEEMKKSEKKS